MKGVKLGLFVDPDTTRYSGLRLRRLKEAIKDSKILDALVEELEVAGAIGSNKMAAIERRIEELRATKGSLWFEVAAPEVLAASIFRAKKLQGPVIDDLFKRVARVQQIWPRRSPSGWTWLASPLTLAARQASAARTSSATAAGPSSRAGSVVGIEVTNDVNELGRALDEPKGSATS